MRYDFHELIARAQALQAQATGSGLPRYAIAALIVADRIQIALEVSVQTLARLAMRFEAQPVFGGVGL